ncbi:glycosyltransferase family 2 protein [Lonsdalea quercina]|uniref:glycosyltransferase family 2 protein n=1 Tax=Lonsdalea quercina TaxID=71657 RepID=UPI0039764836
MHCNYVVVVVLYNKQVAASTTLSTLADYDFKTAKLIIHNNGPQSIELDSTSENAFQQCFGQIELNNCLDNPSLSVIYNRYIQSYPEAEKFVLLDDDTTINETFQQALLKGEADVECPKIISVFDKETYYPMSHNAVVADAEELDPFSAVSIGSGLIIRRSLVDKFRQHGLSLFDEHYALYGVDTSFFRRIHLLAHKGVAITLSTTCYLMHSLSRTEGAMNDFRRKERIWDLAISTRQYPSVRGYYVFLKRVLSDLCAFKFRDTFLLISAFIAGRHPKCRTLKNQ